MFYRPLKYPTYRLIWLATLFSNIGTWIHTVAASLLMTKLSSSAAIIALVQTAAMIPLFIFSIPGGVAADRYNRKRLIIFAHTFMASVAVIMAALSYQGMMTDNLLLGCIFLLNIGLAFNQPAWQTVSSLLVPPTEIKQAAALNNLSYNLSRCIGPAIAGYFFTTLGPSYLFLLNAISFLGVIAVFSFYVNSNNLAPTQTPSVSFYAGLKQVASCFREMPEFKAILIKSFCYFSLSATLFATLPFIVIIHYGMSNHDLGLLMTAAGLGAITCAFSICHLRNKLHDKQMTTLSFMIASFVIISISKATAIYFLAPLMMLFGFSWALAVSVFNGSLQADFPPHIRSRMIGVYTVFFACAQALGSYMGGILVQKIDLAHEQACIAAALAIIALYYAFSPFYFFRRQPHAH